ncbi:MAG: tRNA (N6-isopentenyl adenosine(37)-C2)-methylthiotransferase MiaB [Candidatus Eisenbacteria bacterium]|nr:tRNA (N6-isopentenyl adenosine(37)-C2)-methylthiotransferase MiaB [Candidatus Eisenbacteria bacterium]
MKRVFLETYGCQMNVADSELMAGVLQRAGMEMVERAEDADAVILNTCAIREHAELRVLGRLGEFAHLKSKNPALIVGVAGCMAQHLRKRLLDQKRVLDLVVGPDGYRDLPALLQRAANVPTAEIRLDRDETYGDLEPKRQPGVRAWVTVQRGCDKFCTYCVVPYTRGRERSLPLADLVRQVESAAAQGFCEIVFLGQTVNSYHDGTHDFADLLRAASAVPGVLRVRYTSPHPSDMSERVIAAMAECDKVMPHVHLPLQSGSDAILEAMQRTYSITQFEDVLGRIRAQIPGVAVTTDVIVGFPGESDADFEATRAFMQRARFDSAFLFKYSARPDTRAYKLAETVDETEKGRRLQVLIDEQHAISGEIMDGYLNRTIEVLVDGPSNRGKADQPPQLYGKSREFKTVVWPDDGSPAGTLQQVKIVGTTHLTLLGESVGTPRPEPLITIGVS